MKKIILLAVRLYQRVISPPLVSIFGKQCRFTPTCSEYAYQAVDRYGILYGLWLGTKRIIRCNPFNHGGWDPIPKKA